MVLGLKKLDSSEPQSPDVSKRKKSALKGKPASAEKRKESSKKSPSPKKLSYLNSEVIEKYNAAQPKSYKPLNVLKQDVAFKNYMDMRVSLMKFTIRKGISQAKNKNEAYLKEHKKRKTELGGILVKLGEVRDSFKGAN